MAVVAKTQFANRPEPRGEPEFEPNTAFEEQISANRELDGPFLKAVRVYRRLSPERLAELCKLSAKHVESIENEDGANLHQPVYLRGHVAMICQALQIPEPNAQATFYVNRMKALGKLPKSPY
jgi:hypothetical protein